MIDFMGPSALTTLMPRPASCFLIRTDVPALRRCQCRRAQDVDAGAGWPYLHRTRQWPFLAAGGSGAQFRAGIDRAVALGWLWRHESDTYLKITEGVALFA